MSRNVANMTWKKKKKSSQRELVERAERELSTSRMCIVRYSVRTARAARQPLPCISHKEPHAISVSQSATYLNWMDCSCLWNDGIMHDLELKTKNLKGATWLNKSWHRSARGLEMKLLIDVPSYIVHFRTWRSSLFFISARHLTTPPVIEVYGCAFYQCALGQRAMSDFHLSSF